MIFTSPPQSCREADVEGRTAPPGPGWSGPEGPSDVEGRTSRNLDAV